MVAAPGQDDEHFLHSNVERRITNMNAPQVSVVVPTYNHARFLSRRLDSIDRQSFTDFEVILLDDASSDGSTDILREYARKNPAKTQLVINEANTGSPYAQWARGIGMARGSLIWVAESDDYCDPDFLRLLTLPFADPEVAMAYTAPTYVDFEGQATTYQFAEFTRELSPTKWARSHTTPAKQEVREALGLRNTIPNASAAVFRREAALPYIRDPLWHRMRVCGDWCLYLKMLQERKLAFIKDAGAFFTHTPENTSARAARENTFVVEHGVVVSVLNQCYPDLPAEILDRNFAFVLAHFTWLFGPNLPPFVQNLRSVRFSAHSELQAELSAGRERATLREKELIRLRGECAAQREEAVRWQARVTALHASSSWRLTAPLRHLAQLLKTRPEVPSTSAVPGATTRRRTTGSGPLMDIFVLSFGLPRPMHPYWCRHAGHLRATFHVVTDHISEWHGTLGAAGSPANFVLHGMSLDEYFHEVARSLHLESTARLLELYGAHFEHRVNGWTACNFKPLLGSIFRSHITHDVYAWCDHDMFLTNPLLEEIAERAQTPRPDVCLFTPRGIRWEQFKAFPTKLGVQMEEEFAGQLVSGRYKTDQCLDVQFIYDARRAAENDYFPIAQEDIAVHWRYLAQIGPAADENKIGVRVDLGTGQLYEMQSDREILMLIADEEVKTMTSSEIALCLDPSGRHLTLPYPPFPPA